MFLVMCHLTWNNFLLLKHQEMGELSTTENDKPITLFGFTLTPPRLKHFFSLNGFGYA